MCNENSLVGDETLIYSNESPASVTSNAKLYIDDTADTEALLNNIETMLKSLESNEMSAVKTRRLLQLKSDLAKRTSGKTQMRKDAAILPDDDSDIQIIKEEPVDASEKAAKSKQVSPNKKAALANNANGGNNTSFKKISPKLAPASANHSQPSPAASSTGNMAAKTIANPVNNQNFILTQPVSFIAAQASSQPVKLGNIQIITVPTNATVAAATTPSPAAVVVAPAKQEISQKAAPLDLTKLLNAKLMATSQETTPTSNKIQILGCQANPLSPQAESAAKQPTNSFTLLSAASANLPIIIAPVSTCVDLKTTETGTAKRLKQDDGVKFVMSKPASANTTLNEVATKQEVKANVSLNSTSSANTSVCSNSNTKVEVNFRFIPLF